MEAKRSPYEGRDEAERGGARPVVPFEGQACLLEGAGNNGVRDSRRRFGCHSNFGDIGVQAKVARALGFHCERYQQLVRDECGQGTVEYAVVLFAVLSVLAALAAVSQLWETGLVMEHVLQSASHHVGASISGFVDAFVY